VCAGHHDGRQAHTTGGECGSIYAMHAHMHSLIYAGKKKYFDLISYNYYLLI